MRDAGFEPATCRGGDRLLRKRQVKKVGRVARASRLRLLIRKPEAYARTFCFTEQVARFGVLRWRVSVSRRDRCRWRKRALRLW